MKHPATRDLHGYWDALRAGRTAPERRDIDPAAIRHLLAYTFVLDVSGEEQAGRRSVSFRVSGARLDALFQRDLRDRAFASIWTPGDMRTVEAMLDVAIDGRTPAVGSARGAPLGYLPIDVELLLLPLRHHGRTHARLLGSLAAAEAPGWMGLCPVEVLHLPWFRTVTGAGAVARDPAAPDPAPPRPFRVYEGGRSGRAAALLER